MTTKGKIEVRINSGIRATGEYFVSLHNFLSGTCSSIGVTRIASNYGSGGTGFGYWDTSPSATPGTNAWAVFRFGNAQIPFNVLIQVVNINSANVTTLGANTNVTVPASNVGNQSTYYGVLITVAQRLDGTNPWAGGTANVGADAKATTVWTPGTSTLIAYPRTNSVGGGFATNREGCMNLNYVNLQVATGGANDQTNDIYNYGTRSQFLADENNLLIVDDTGANGNNKHFYFGKYVPRPGVNPQAPYVCMNQMYQLHDPIVARYNYGSVNQTVGVNNYATTIGDGGICHPTASNGVKLVYPDYVANAMSTFYQPNRTVTNQSRYELFPVYIGMNESTTVGLLGSIDFFRLISNVPTYYTNSEKTLAVFGGSSGNTTTKLAIPWDGKTSPGSGISREGIDF